jgi:solute carrier family 25 protein 39/40
MLASLVTHPFDVLKTRIQVIPSHLKQEVSAFGMLRKIVKEEGLRRLFAGVGPRTAKVAPACGLMIGCYEGVGRILGDK